MTDVSPDPDWWQASDGKWYPPHLHPDVLNAGQASTPAPEAASVFEPAHDAAPAEPDLASEPVAEPTVDAASAASDAAPEPTVDPAPEPTFEPATQPPAQPTTSLPPYTPAEAPQREPIDWEKVAAERNARRHAEESKRRRRIVGAVLVALGALALLVGIATNRGDGDDDQADQPAPSSTEQPSSTVDSTTTAPVDSVTTVPGVTTVSVFELQPGMCVNNAELSTGLVTDLTAVPCDQPHTHEVYFKVTFAPPDGAYDAQRVAAFADEQCSQAFSTYVGVTYDKSKYYFLHLAPSAESWKEQGDRDVVCLLFQQGATLTGSAQGTAQ